MPAWRWRSKTRRVASLIACSVGHRRSQWGTQYEPTVVARINALLLHAWGPTFGRRAGHGASSFTNRAPVPSTKCRRSAASQATGGRVTVSVPSVPTVRASVRVTSPAWVS